MEVCNCPDTYKVAVLKRKIYLMFITLHFHFMSVSTSGMVHSRGPWLLLSSPTYCL
jgi:hypothetical protein